MTEHADTSQDAVLATRTRLRTFVARRAPPWIDADDVVQDVLTRLLERADGVSPASIDAWALTSARNAIVDQVRRRRPSGLEDEGSVVAADDATTDMDLADLARCMRPMLDRLGEEDRSLLERVDAGGASQADVARELGVPLSTMKSRVQRARRRLRAIMERCCEVELDARGAPIDARRRDSCGECPGTSDRHRSGPGRAAATSGCAGRSSAPSDARARRAASPLIPLGDGGGAPARRT